LQQINHSLANGVGLGFTYALLYYSTQLSEAVGNGVILSSTCPLDLYFTTGTMIVLILGITLMLLSLVFVILTIVNFYGHYNNQKISIFVSLILYYIMSALPKFFGDQRNGCISVFTIMSLFILTFSIGIYNYAQVLIKKKHHQATDDD
jgi:hypothetical protein